MSKKRKLLLIVLTVFVIVSGIFLYQMIQWANKPVTEDIHINNVSQESDKPVPDQDLITHFFSTKVPDNFRIQTSDIPAAEKNLIQVVAYENKGGGRQVGIRSNTMPAEGLKGIGDYNYRLKTPLEYTEYKGRLPVHSYGFRKVDGTEVTVFLTKGDRYASVAVTTKSDPNKLEELLNKVMDHWSWN